MRVPKYRLHKPTGQAVVTINGKDHYLGRHTSKPSKQLYDRLIAEWLAGGRSEVYGKTPPSITVAEIALAYLKHAKKYYGIGPSSEWHRIKSALRPLAKLYSRLPAADYGPKQFKATREGMIELDWSRNNINANMRRITRMFRWAVGEGLLKTPVHELLRSVDPLKAGRTNARESEPVKPVDEDIVKVTIAVMTPTLADMVQVQLLIGCRPGEVCNLTPAMIDRSGDIWEATLTEHKNAHRGHVRTLYIGPDCQAIIAKYLDDRGADDCLFRPCDSDAQRRAERKKNRTTPLNEGNRPGYGKNQRAGFKPKQRPGLRYTNISFARAVRRACAIAGVEMWSPNQLRHTRGTNVRRDYGLDAAAATLGHAKVETTQIYAEQNKNLARKVAAETG